MSKTVTIIISLLIVTAIGVGGFFMIKKQEEELAKQSRTQDLARKTTALQESRKIILPNQDKEERSSSLYLKTLEEIVNKGDEFTLEVWVDGMDKIVDGAEFILTYDSKAVKITEVQEGNFFTLYPQKNIDNKKGTIRVIALRSPDDSKTLGQQVVVTLLVEVLKAGKAEFNFQLDKTHIAGYGGQDLLQEAQPLTINIK